MSVEYPPMDDVIDLRKYLNILLDHKWLIIGFTLVSALLGFGFASLLPRKYEATSIVAITQSRNQLSFDPRIETVVDPSLNYQSFAALAVSDSLVMDLYNSLEALPKDADSPLTLRKQLDANIQSDLVTLTVQARDPVIAETVANKWAELFVQKANQVYNSQDATQITFFESQLSDASDTLQKTNQAMIDFQARNRENILSDQLKALQTSLANLLAEQQTSQVLLRDTRNLITQLRTLPADQQVSESLAFSVLLLQNRAYTDSTGPIQLMVGGSTQALPTAGDQVRQLEALADVVETKIADLAGQISELDPQITQTQSELAAATAEKDKLTRDQSVAQDTYSTLSQKVEEVRIGSQDTSGQVRLASYALADDNPVFPSRLLITALAGAAGFVFIVMVILFLAWWRTPAPQVDPETQSVS
jgi:uncharacterized protein involved in exopolysaccharide biosynthesis